jgi:hypothetical protein
MRLARRLIGMVLGSAGAAGVVLCVAGLVGCWVAYFEVLRRVDRVFDRADRALVEIRENLDQVGTRLRQTELELETVQKRETDVASTPPAERVARRAESRKLVETVNPHVGEIRELLVKATEAALVANGLLDALAELPIVDRVSVDTDRLKETSAQLSVLAERSARLASLLGRPTPTTDDEISGEASRAAEALRRTMALADSGTARLESGRERIADGRGRAIRCTNAVAVTLTVVLLWIAIGQLSLLLHGRSLSRHCQY